MPLVSSGTSNELGVIAGDLYRSRFGGGKGHVGRPEARGKKPKMIRNLIRLWRDEEGATAVEYGLIVAAIAMTVVIVFMLIGNKANNTLNNVAAKFP